MIRLERSKREAIVPYLYLMPALVFLLVIVFFPVVLSLMLSFFEFSGYKSNIFSEFVGFENFKFLFQQRYFWISARNTLYFVGSMAIIQTALALFLAVMIYFGNFKHSKLIRMIIFAPGVLAPVSISLIWRRMLEQDGVLNQILHIDFPWLATVDLAIWVVIFVNIWQWIGYSMVIFYAGLQSMSIEILEAADIDGAGWTQKIFRIVVPFLKPITVLNIILNVIGSFRAFDIIYVLTRGGPAHHSEVFTTLMYFYSFNAMGPHKLGVGAAIAFVMFTAILIFGAIRIRLISE
jgi:ABC-type sugar transport system permease subunit